MYTILNNSIASITFRGKLFDQRVMTTHHYYYSGVTQADGRGWLLARLNAMLAAGKLYALWRGALSQSVINMEVVGQWIQNQRYRPIVVSPVVTVGSRGDANAPNAAMVVTLTSDLAGRHGVGNKHLPGVPYAEVTAGVLSAGQLAANGNYAFEATQQYDDGAGNVLTPCIYNRASPNLSRVITGYIVNDSIRTERRRTLRVGE